MDQVQYELTKIKNKIKDLAILHDKYLTRPTLDDDTNEEKVIDALTQEITKVKLKFHALFLTIFVLISIDLDVQHISN